MKDKDNVFYRFEDKKVRINLSKFIKFLNFHGIFLYSPDGKSHIYIHVEDHIIEEYSTAQIKQLVLFHIGLSNSSRIAAVIEQIHQSVSQLFSPKLLETLPILRPRFMKDSKDHAYVFYTNGFLLIKKDGVVFNEYSSLPAYIWKSRIIQRRFVIPNSQGANDPGEFGKFIANISGNDQDKQRSIESVIGYLLHGYKDPSNPVAVILMDEIRGNAGSPNGRTGKGIILSGISKWKKVTKEDGKLFTAKANFVFQQVEIDTEILAFDDVPANFDLLKLFSIISEGIMIEKKFKDKFVIPYADAPKVLITSNYSLPGTGESYSGRRIEFALNHYYDSKHRPIDDFGHRLYDDWDEKEWQKFDFYMIHCLHTFLKGGLYKNKPKERELDRLASQTSAAFTSFCAEYLEINKEIDVGELFNKFQIYDYSHAEITQNRFTRWLKMYAEHTGHNIGERFSNGRKYVTLSLL